MKYTYAKILSIIGELSQTNLDLKQATLIKLLLEELHDYNMSMKEKGEKDE